MSDQIFIQHRFKVERDGLVLDDAITLPIAEYEAMKPEEIESAKEERFANFKEAVTNPPKQEEPTKEEKIASLDRDLASLEEQKVSLLALKSEEIAKVDEIAAEVKEKPVK